jgi:hypothetical protein
MKNHRPAILIFTRRALPNAPVGLFDVEFARSWIKLNGHKCAFTGLNAWWVFICGWATFLGGIE